MLWSLLMKHIYQLCCSGKSEELRKSPLILIIIFVQLSWDTLWSEYINEGKDWRFIGFSFPFEVQLFFANFRMCLEKDDAGTLQSVFSLDASFHVCSGLLNNILTWVAAVFFLCTTFKVSENLFQVILCRMGFRASQLYWCTSYIFFFWKRIM